MRYLVIEMSDGVRWDIASVDSEEEAMKAIENSFLECLVEEGLIDENTSLESLGSSGDIADDLGGISWKIHRGAAWCRIHDIYYDWIIVDKESF